MELTALSERVEYQEIVVKVSQIMTCHQKQRGYHCFSSNTIRTRPMIMREMFSNSKFFIISECVNVNFCDSLLNTTSSQMKTIVIGF